MCRWQWYQFTIRLPLLLMLVASAALARRLSELQREKEVAAALQFLGAEVETSWTGPQWLHSATGSLLEPLCVRVTSVVLPNTDEQTEAAISKLPWERLGALQHVEIRNAFVFGKEPSAGLSVLCGYQFWEKIPHEIEIHELEDAILSMPIQSLVDGYHAGDITLGQLASLLQHREVRQIRFKTAPKEWESFSDRHWEFPENEDRLGLAALLESKDPDVLAVASAAAWQGHSRFLAEEVIAYVESLAAPSPYAPGLRDKVNSDLSPAGIRRQFQQGNNEWALWLARLRPHPDLVSATIESSRRPEFEALAAYTLGFLPGDAARTRLLELTRTADGSLRVEAAIALARHGDPAAEALLLEAVTLSKHDGDICRVSRVLSQHGSASALPVLERQIVERQKCYYTWPELESYRAMKSAAATIRNRESFTVGLETARTAISRND